MRRLTDDSKIAISAGIAIAIVVTLAILALAAIKWVTTEEEKEREAQYVQMRETIRGSAVIVCALNTRKPAPPFSGQQ